MTGPLPEDVLEAKKGALMHTVPHHAMPATRRVRKQWVSALLWLLFCAAMVVIGLFLTPEFGAVDAPDGVPLLRWTPRFRWRPWCCCPTSSRVRRSPGQKIT